MRSNRPFGRNVITLALTVALAAPAGAHASFAFTSPTQPAPTTVQTRMDLAFEGTCPLGSRCRMELLVGASAALNDKGEITPEPSLRRGFSFNGGAAVQTGTHVFTLVRPGRWYYQLASYTTPFGGTEQPLSNTGPLPYVIRKFMERPSISAGPHTPRYRYLNSTTRFRGNALLGYRVVVEYSTMRNGKWRLAKRSVGPGGTFGGPLRPGDLNNYNRGYQAPWALPPSVRRGTRVRAVTKITSPGLPALRAQRVITVPF